MEVTYPFKIINVNDIILNGQDIIEVSTMQDFIEVWTYYFKKTPVFNLNGTLYLCGTECVYLLKKS